MAKKIQLTIPKPCHEDWSKMTPVDKGRFCSSCQTPVIDFTRMSDAQLVAFFRKPSTGSVCGRLMQHQLGRDMDIPRKRIPWLKYFFQFAVPAFLISSKAVAQGQPIVLTGDSIVHSPQTNIRGQVMIVPEHEISGQVTNYGEEGIPHITVSVNGIFCVTDSNGYFRLIYKGVERKIKLNVSGEGFESAQKTIRLGKKINSKRYVELTLAKSEDIVVVVGMMGVNIYRKDELLNL